MLYLGVSPQVIAAYPRSGASWLHAISRVLPESVEISVSRTSGEVLARLAKLGEDASRDLGTNKHRYFLLRSDRTGRLPNVEQDNDPARRVGARSPTYPDEHGGLWNFEDVLGQLRPRVREPRAYVSFCEVWNFSEPKKEGKKKSVEVSQ